MADETAWTDLLRGTEAACGVAGPSTANPPSRWSKAEWHHFLLRKAYLSFSVALFFYLGATYNVVYLNRVLPALGKDDRVLTLRALFNAVLGMALACYFRAHTMDAGKLPEGWKDFVYSSGNALAVVRPREEWQPRKATFCRRCSIPRPERAHHCSVCGHCILRFDHHCPWIDNCVGFNNHKLFLLAMGYGFLACLIALVTTCEDYWHCVAACARALATHTHSPDQALEALVAWRGHEDLTPIDVLSFQILCFLSLGLGTLLGFLLKIHLPLALRNCSTVEGNYENMPNPFDLGGWRANLAQLFGGAGIDWLLPTRPCKPICDGVNFEHVDEPAATVTSSYSTAKASSLSLSTGGHAPLDLEVADSEDILKSWRMRYNVRPKEVGAASRPGSPSGARAAESSVDTGAARVFRWLEVGPLLGLGSEADAGAGRSVRTASLALQGSMQGPSPRGRAPRAGEALISPRATSPVKPVVVLLADDKERLNRPVLPQERVNPDVCGCVRAAPGSPRVSEASCLQPASRASASPAFNSGYAQLMMLQEGSPEDLARSSRATGSTEATRPSREQPDMPKLPLPQRPLEPHLEAAGGTYQRRIAALGEEVTPRRSPRDLGQKADILACGLVCAKSRAERENSTMLSPRREEEAQAVLDPDLVSRDSGAWSPGRRPSPPTDEGGLPTPPRPTRMEADAGAGPPPSGKEAARAPVDGNVIPASSGDPRRLIKL